MPSRKSLLFGSVAVTLAIFAIVASFFLLDLPIAHFFAGTAHVEAYGISSLIILSGEFAVIAVLAVMRLARGHLAAAWKALLLANLASICAFVANDYVLKHIFGVPNPSDVQRGAVHGLHPFLGNDRSSFPSGHMAMASAFAGVWIRLYPKTTILFAVLIFFGMVILVVGEWHFLSDVIAGTLLGIGMGLVAGELWLAHSAGGRAIGRSSSDA